MLTLSFNPVGAAAVSLARSLPNLAKLRLASAEIDDAAAIALFGALGGSLHDLDLDYNPITDASVDAIAAASAQLSSVSLGATKLTPDGKKAIQRALSARASKRR